MVLMDASKERKLLFLLARFPYNENVKEEIKKTILQEEIDWVKLFEVAKEQRITLIVFDRLQEFSSIPPKDVFERFKNNCQRQLKKNLLNTKELLSIHDSAKKIGLEIIPYKGTVFAKEVYGGFNLRASGDIDFWYFLSDKEVLKKLMIKSGFEPLIDYNKIQEFFFTKINCEFHFYKKYENQGLGVLVEPHHFFIKHFIQKNPTEEDLLKYTKIQTLFGREMKVFSPELTIVYIVLHHGTIENWFLIKNHVDLAAYINRYFDEVDWDEILNVCRKYEIEKVFLVGVNMTKKIFALELPRILEEAQGQKDIEYLSELCFSKWITFFEKEEEPTSFKIYFLWKTRRNFTQKIKLCWNIIKYSFLRILFSLSMLIKTSEPKSD
jgi:hypothetical protein